MVFEPPPSDPAELLDETAVGASEAGARVCCPDDGCIDGESVGTFDGDTERGAIVDRVAVVGTVVGVADDGRMVGTTVGAAELGARVAGAKLGTIVNGTRVGDWVIGTWVGADVGWADALVGARVGAGVGWADALVGAKVGGEVMGASLVGPIVGARELHTVFPETPALVAIHWSIWRSSGLATIWIYNKGWIVDISVWSISGRYERTQCVIGQTNAQLVRMCTP